MTRPVELPLTGCELPLAYLKENFDEPVSKALLHEEAERLLMRFVDYAELKGQHIEIVHVMGPPSLPGYIQLRAPTFGIEIGSHPITCGIGARIAARSPALSTLGLYPVEIPLEHIYDPGALLQDLVDNKIRLKQSEALFEDA